MHQHPLPSSFAPGSSASPSSAPPPDARERAAKLLLGLALAATLPRVLWSSATFADIDHEVWRLLAGVLRVVSVVASIVVVALVAAARDVDALPVGSAAATARRRAVALLTVELVWGFLREPFLDVLVGGAVGSLFANLVLCAVPLLADLALAAWLAAVLRAADQKPWLPPVIWMSYAVGFVGSFGLGLGLRFGWVFTEYVVVAVLLVEVLRVRRAITETG